jgi:hypothetical protein
MGDETTLGDLGRDQSLKIVSAFIRQKGAYEYVDSLR